MANDENASWLFGGDNGEKGEWEAHRRFISPQYNAIYRQGVVGPRHLRESEFALFLQAAREGSPSASEQFKRWYLTDRLEGGDYGDVAMERIGARAHSLDAETALGIVRVFADVMDEYYRTRPKREMFVDTWQQTERILRTFHTSVPDFKLGDVSLEIAGSGKAIAWMCSAIARDEMWGHGLAGDRRREESLHLLNPLEVKAFTSTLIERISAMATPELLDLPRFSAVMYMLKDSPWLKDVVDKVIQRLAGPRTSDATFLSFLEAMAGVVISSDRGVYRTISQKAIASIIGDEQFDRRWSRMVKKSLPEELATKRARIIAMMAEAKNW
jgi:hypothetical protein